VTADFWETIFKRHSIRRYLDRSVSPSVVERILRAAAHAPSAHNSQPWHFVVISSPETRRELSERMAHKYERDMISWGVPAHKRRERVQRSLTLFNQAPVIIVAFLANKLRGKKELASDENLEEVMDRQSVAVAVGHLLLAATASGLGACWYAAPLFCPEIVTRQLGVNTDWEPQALVTLGYPDEVPQPKKKKPLKTIVTHA
jgi:F420 biosynthesis protein FbiB-like protein